MDGVPDLGDECGRCQATVDKTEPHGVLELFGTWYLLCPTCATVIIGIRRTLEEVLSDEDDTMKETP